ncbi:hypothetical protein DFP92_1288 [Yoonia sediminilitoris]|uniref:Uncharacterized protein n=1 Tax=Yoonia sediminilitoris TaxID=1286148 RepID=A0A2T6K4Q3_9RHOB|nr:hypothetical protein C8N45_1288 [Yoonia sediminilitoris]RCW89513.1 hypothetical protein DFP92_1288 [Yoonia sediminilitoris]
MLERRMRILKTARLLGLINPGQNIMILSQATFDNPGEVHRRKCPYCGLGTAGDFSVVVQ